MPGKRAPSAKTAKSTGAAPSKTRSHAHAKPKANAGAPKSTPKRSSKTHKDAQKARDADARDSLNGADDSLRAALLSGGETDVVVKAREKPTELLAGGDQLAAMLTAGLGM